MTARMTATRNRTMKARCETLQTNDDKTVERYAWAGTINYTEILGRSDQAHKARDYMNSYCEK